MALFGRKLRDPVEGTFTVTGTTVLSRDEGGQRMRVSGVLSGTGVAAAGVHVDRSFPVNQAIPAAGDTLSAMVDRARPAHYTISWPAWESTGMNALREQAHAEQVAAALRLGLAASVVPADTGPAPTMRQWADRTLAERYARGPLPDGNRQVTADEATRLYTDGLPAMATITGIDYLSVPRKAIPPDASLANVAVTVTRADGTTYQTTARFGFRSARRRERFGFVGARVPVRVDPADQRRVCVDAPALSPEDG